uniref:hypothetical protein n=1 Tax=Niallia taxi TaxID=2499688 RepID=UPI003F49364D
MGQEEKIIKITEKVQKETIISEETKQAEKIEYVFLLNSFFEREFDDPKQLLDKFKGKDAREARVYVCLKFEYETNTFLIPLKKDLGSSLLKNPYYKDVYYPVPSSSKPEAGLDFRKIIIANDESQYRVDEARISAGQRKIMQDNFETIKSLAIKYINGFKKAAKKNRHKKDSYYNFSALSNFLEELGVKKEK